MKLFVVSDIHSYFTIFHDELKGKGFEENNPDHLLVVCGDLFDRGPETVELIEYINSLTNIVLVKGNHETLMEDMWERGYAKSHDVSNGTLRTANDILYDKAEEMGKKEPFTIIREVLEPIFNRTVNYFETKNYVFVHGWIPMRFNPDDPFAIYDEPTLYDPNWREGDWEEARWFNGIKKALQGIIVPDKTVVCGHWHCSYGHMRDSIKTDNWISEFEEDAKWDPYYSKGIIAIDRCTAFTNECNVLVLEDELLEEKVN